ncbi:MAG: sodium:proline symporter [Clostridiales bacterium]|nr:sodium:proline symporter [Clostridiales bacterium]
MNVTELIVFIIYLLFMLGIGFFFFFKKKNAGEKDYFLGGRKQGAWVSALSAGASDMSAWVLMGLPASIYLYGLGETWIAIGLLIGYALSWIIEAPRLRRFSIVADDSITIPQYLTNRFKSSSKALQVVCAVIFLVAYTVYAASSINACGKLFNQVIGMDTSLAMVIAAVIIIGYTFMGGFSAVCVTDFFQGLLMLGALLLTPIFALGITEFGAAADANKVFPDGFWNMTGSWKSIASGLGWGIGYFGMPHIIIRFMAVRSQKELKKSSVIGISWTALILLFSCAAAIAGRFLLGNIESSDTVFIQMTRRIFPPVISGIVLSAILAASMSTADSQLLASASAFSSDVYKPIIRKNKASDKEILWVSRIVVAVIAVIALGIAIFPQITSVQAAAETSATVSRLKAATESIMSLVSNAWGIFGAAFGPAIMLSLFWKRFNFAGATAGIIAGAATDILWLIFLSDLGIYEIIPGALVGLAVSVIVSLLTKKPSKEVEELYETAKNYTDPEQ